jgi:hypothetical protein
MILRCGVCERYLDEEQFAIQARIENEKKWVGKGTAENQLRIITSRGGRSYTCKRCYRDAERERINELRIINGEYIKKCLIRSRRYILKKKCLKEGYKNEEAIHMAEVGVPYKWKIEGYIWNEELRDWVEENN